eukprot:355232-Chlamydomonas_euryale.AAC.4
MRKCIPRPPLGLYASILTDLACIILATLPAYVVPVLLYALPENSSLTDQQLQPLGSFHNSYLRRVTGMGKRPDATLFPTAQMCAAAGEPPAHADPKCGEAHAPRKQVARMPDGSVVKQPLVAERLVCMEWSAGHTPLGEIGMLQP